MKTTDPKLLGLDSNKLSELDTVIVSDYSNIRGIVVLRNGQIAFENYYLGYGPDDACHIASATKSVISALIGIAINKGYITSIDQKVPEFFPEYTPSLDNKNITIRHLLTMTAPYPFENWQEPLDKLTMSKDWVKYTIDMLGQGGNIGEFKYSTAGAHLLSAIITRATGKSAREFANEHLFKPIGMKTIPDNESQVFDFDSLFGKNVEGWVRDPKGNSAGGWGLTLTPRDMARFGLLYLNDGMWKYKEIVSKSWIDKSIAPNKNNYGYLWWLMNEKDVFAYAAMGDGGNTICCIPSKDMVVAIASEFIPNPHNRWELIKENILTALIDR